MEPTKVLVESLLRLKRTNFKESMRCVNSLFQFTHLNILISKGQDFNSNNIYSVLRANSKC